jgi:serine/threonine protein kinase
MIDAAGAVTLIDFGLSIVDGDFTTDFAGSTEYACPELLLSRNSYSSRAADVWAAGVTVRFFIDLWRSLRLI